MLQKLLSWLVNRMKEGGTWVGLTALGAIFGLSPDGTDAILQAIVAISAVVNIFTKSPKSPDAQPSPTG